MATAIDTRPTARPKKPTLLEHLEAHPRVREARRTIDELTGRLQAASAALSTLEHQKSDTGKWAKDGSEEELQTLLVKIAAAQHKRDAIAAQLRQANEASAGTLAEARAEAARLIHQQAAPRQRELVVALIDAVRAVQARNQELLQFIREVRAALDNETLTLPEVGLPTNVAIALEGAVNHWGPAALQAVGA